MCILAYLEFLVKHCVSTNMVTNYVAQFIMYDLNGSVLDLSKVKYFIRALKIRQIQVMIKRNFISLDILKCLINECNFIYAGKVFKAIFLMAFFGFWRILNLAPPSVGGFDSTRHLTLSDISFKQSGMKVAFKCRRSCRPGIKSTS